ncbi:sulfotransferase domain-containing protein [Actinomadura bangladeshensis]|uniref:Sulfotransferase n=1 Tax=Actinomadura bangladeshensis TaxID=453573 RepID=A0A4R4NHR5_9ACTN|nr:sulfotransferase domain-containing protein [Actinomadura bangladeshensis]TDC08821.1 sulfotransferase [Actinomadura bangladeshensis]
MADKHQAARPPGHKRLAQAAAVTAGKATHRARMLPGFLIVGGQRCGTTSMYRTLSQHPALLKALWHKGVHYFDTGYGNGPAWYRGHFPLRSTAARVESRHGVKPLAFESSPYYGFHPLAGARIAADLPEVKLLMLVRDPVERAYSAHSHEFGRGFETEPFERAVELEEQRLEGEAERLAADPSATSHAYQHNAYLARGRYIEQIERLEKLVGRDRLLVVDSHEFFTEPETVYKGVLDFLGVPPLGSPVFERHNARSRSPLPDALHARLEEYFRPYDERLAEWLGRTPSWRR